MDKEKELSAQDFNIIKELRTKNAFIATRAEKAILESKVAELEYKTVVLNTYIKYGLSLTDSIDETTGKIVYDANKTKEEKGQE